MPSPVDPVRVGFVGAGAMARAHARALAKSSVPVRIVGVFDPDRACALEFAEAGGGEACASLGTLLDTRPSVVHVCTPPGTHFEPARAALMAGAHVYVEKPFVESESQATELLQVAASRYRLICAGHQLLADPAFDSLRRRVASLGRVVHVESRFSFRSPTLRAGSPLQSVAAQLVDVLPHPLYSLIAMLEAAAPHRPVEVATQHATPNQLDAVLRAGDVSGRLFVSLDARPVASTLTVTGTEGSLTADFIRGHVSGVPNEGTAPLEKILNVAMEGSRQAVGSLVGIAVRLSRHGEYPGLISMLERFYTAVRLGGPSPTGAGHLRRVTGAYSQLRLTINDATQVALSRQPLHEQRSEPAAPIAVVTGAGGYLGRAVAEHLAARGFAVRGVGRGAPPHARAIAEWRRADLSREIDDEVFEDATIVVHTAAATSGGYAAHQRNSVDAARNVVRAAAAAGASRLIHVSSLSVVEPPASWTVIQDEDSPVASGARALGAYTWGKCESERAVIEEAHRVELPVAIVRPGAIVSETQPELPGLVGRRVFGRWHLCLGRPGLPFFSCELQQVAAVIAWYAASDDDLPAVLHLFDPAVPTRGALVRQFRGWGWRGRCVWIPIAAIAGGAALARALTGLIRRQPPQPFSFWQVLRPRRFDATRATRLLAAADGSEAIPADAEPLDEAEKDRISVGAP